MSNESKYERRFNPLEMSVDEAGGYIQRVPLCMDDALYTEFPSSPLTARVLIWIVKKASNLTYLSGKDEIQAVKISSTELGRRLRTTQQCVAKCLKELVVSKWITNTNTKKCSTGVYLVDFEKVRVSTQRYFMEFGE